MGLACDAYFDGMREEPTSLSSSSGNNASELFETKLEVVQAAFEDGVEASFPVLSDITPSPAAAVFQDFDSDLMMPSSPFGERKLEFPATLVEKPSPFDDDLSFPLASETPWFVSSHEQDTATTPKHLPHLQATKASSQDGFQSLIESDRAGGLFDLWDSSCSRGDLGFCKPARQQDHHHNSLRTTAVDWIGDAITSSDWHLNPKEEIIEDHLSSAAAASESALAFDEERDRLWFPCSQLKCQPSTAAAVDCSSYNDAVLECSAPFDHHQMAYSHQYQLLSTNTTSPPPLSSPQSLSTPRMLFTGAGHEQQNKNNSSASGDGIELDRFAKNTDEQQQEATAAAAAAAAITDESSNKLPAARPGRKCRMTRKRRALPYQIPPIYLLPHKSETSSIEQPPSSGASSEESIIEERNLEFLLQKQLQPSDVGNLGRIVLPKRDAESCLPYLAVREGITIVMEDLTTSYKWHMRYRFWPNNKSRMYLLENTGEFVRSHCLREGDLLIIYKDPATGKYVILGKKASESDVPRRPSGYGPAKKKATAAATTSAITVAVDLRSNNSSSNNSKSSWKGVDGNPTTRRMRTFNTKNHHLSSSSSSSSMQLDSDEGDELANFDKFEASDIQEILTSLG